MRSEPTTQVNVGAVIVAAGRGRRMQGVDKLLAPLAGRPMLAHTLAAFQACAAVQRVVLVMAADRLEEGRELVRAHGLDKVAAVCAGGERRQDSVRAGLDALGPCQWAVVHDGARPLVTPRLIEDGLAAARETGAAICAVPLSDTLKRVSESQEVERTVEREGLWLVQTPQVFRYDLLLGAHRRATVEATDDAALVEAMGGRVRVYMGSPRNIKVTTPEDLALAEALVRRET
jgi:2-C-methyl-D-erythritol 4-phosphate cytidylyltransferase